MKKCYSLLLALLITGCAQQTDLLFKNKPAAVAPKETITHHFVSESGRRKLSMQLKFVAAQKMLLETETQQRYIGYGFITLGIYTPLEARVYCSVVHELPIGIRRSIYTAH